MYSTQFLPFVVVHHIRCQKIFKYYPFRFNPTLKRFVSMNSPHGDRMFKLLLLTMLSYTVSVSCHLLVASMPVAKKFQGFAFCVMYVTILGSSWNYNLDNAHIQMINSCLDFETKISEGEAKLEKTLQVKAMLIFFHILKESHYLIPLACLGLTLMDPCTPPFILSMSKSCSVIRWNGLIILIPLLETYLCFCVFYIGTTPIVYNLFAGISSMLSYFQLLERKISKAISLAEIDSCVSTYRMVQLIEKIMNAFLMESVVPSLICGVPLLQIVVQYATITMHGEIAMPVFLILWAEMMMPPWARWQPRRRRGAGKNVERRVEVFTLGTLGPVCVETERDLPFYSRARPRWLPWVEWWDRRVEYPFPTIFPVIQLEATLNNIVIFTLASWVFNSSIKSLKKLDGTTLQFVRRSVIRKKLKACGTLKIKFGSNFIDSGTPLVIQNFCLNQTMSLILMKEGKRNFGM
ncbi:hypothetical protein Fcan01_17249 [Folsomia candida]|uniref:Uncharacterized protein n=1 Tax=Folsomia candida TaxID=158441 RepID=A0A226DUE7_FOLCA|nr:hypothetical protein Fcan01_17249 [Folsomia candida]